MNSSDFTPGGLDESEALALSRPYADAGLDSIEVSGNGTSVAGVRAGRGEAYKGGAMPEKLDLRVIKTRRSIETAFITLLGHKQFEQITVQNILDAALAFAYYRDHYVDTRYLDGLREELSSTTKALDNLIRAIEQGLPFSDSIARRLNENEERKKALLEAIEAEETRARVAQDESSIKALFEKYANADFDDPETRDTVLSYFIDKIYLYDDGHFEVTGWYWDFEHEINPDLFEDLPERASGFEYSLDLDPGGFARFADGGTIANELPYAEDFARRLTKMAAKSFLDVQVCDHCDNDALSVAPWERSRLEAGEWLA